MAILMQTNKIIQAVILMLILAMAASCAMGKQYSSKVFGPRTSPSKEPVEAKVRFLGADEAPDSTGSLTLTKPVTTSDSAVVVIPVIKTGKPIVDTMAPVVRSGNSGGVRSKRTRDDQ
jgi:hypothetical protein